MATLFTYFWKLLLCGLAFYVGIIMGAAAAPLLGLPVPAIPPGVDQATLSWYLVPVSLILALTLSFIARGLSGGFVARWLILAAFVWIVYALNNYLEASIFSSYEAASPFMLVVFLAASIWGGAAAALLFAPGAPGTYFAANLRAFGEQYTIQGWVWRSLAALAAFPAIYVFFGSLVAPFVIDYYREQSLGLVLPGWAQIIPMQFLRSLLFLLACLPVLIAWQRSRRSLLLSLGWALFVLVGLLNLLQAIWLPATLRLVHTLEILADSFVYAWVLVILSRRSDIAASRPAALPAAR
ncbi:MAG TPA: hypothetical protein VFO07_19000 [Roseiflexaceae bacterium]|nr:hypothetical protein [Roseiflexaceae bacterium]